MSEVPPPRASSRLAAPPLSPLLAAASAPRRPSASSLEGPPLPPNRRRVEGGPWCSLTLVLTAMLGLLALDHFVSRLPGHSVAKPDDGSAQASGEESGRAGQPKAALTTGAAAENALEDENANLTCQELRARGPDATLWELMRPVRGVTEDLPWGVVFFFRLATGGLAGYAFVQGPGWSRWHCFKWKHLAYISSSLFLVVTLGPLAVQVVLYLGFVIIYPVAVKLEAYHFERAILFCLPLPGRLPDVGFGWYIFPLYALRSLWGVKCIVRARLQSPSDSAYLPEQRSVPFATPPPAAGASAAGASLFGQRGLAAARGMTALSEWRCWQSTDALTDWATLYMLAGRVWAPLWYFWALTAIASAGAIGWSCYKPPHSTRDFAYFLLTLLAFEHLPQIALVLAAAALTRGGTSGAALGPLDQYVVYSFAGAVLAAAELAVGLGRFIGASGWAPLPRTDSHSEGSMSPILMERGGGISMEE